MQPGPTDRGSRAARTRTIAGRVIAGRTLRLIMPAWFAALALSAAPAAGSQFVLTILHINDLHSRLQPVNAFNAVCPPGADEAGECFGGIARVKTLIDERRAAGEAAGEVVLVLDAGDQFQGSLFYRTYRGQAAAEFMNDIAFDAMALGNHEFDDGPGVLARFVEELDFPVLGANVDVTTSPDLAGLIAPFAVIERGNQRIGVIGAVTEDTAVISSPGPDVQFQPVVAALERGVAVLEAQGIDKIIALTHIGLDADRRIARTVAGIDAVVGGHSHTLLADEPGSEGSYPVIESGAAGSAVPIVQAHAYGRRVGELRLAFDAAGNVIEFGGTSHPLDASVAAHAATADRVAALAEPFEAMMREVVAHVSSPIDAGGCRRGECEMGNLVADAMLDRVRSQGVQLALINGGGLRASLDAGEVTAAEIATVLPFGNTLATFTISGAGIRAALENGVSRFEEHAGRFPQVAGMRFAFDPSAPPGHRVRDVSVETGNGFEPLDPERDYLAVSHDYLRRGGDDYAVLRDGATNAYDFGPALESVVTGYLAARPDYRARIDGRITESTPGG